MVNPFGGAERGRGTPAMDPTEGRCGDPACQRPRGCGARTRKRVAAGKKNAGTWSCKGQKRAGTLRGVALKNHRGRKRRDLPHPPPTKTRRSAKDDDEADASRLGSSAGDLQAANDDDEADTSGLGSSAGDLQAANDDDEADTSGLGSMALQLPGGPPQARPPPQHGCDLAGSHPRWRLFT